MKTLVATVSTLAVLFVGFAAHAATSKLPLAIVTGTVTEEIQLANGEIKTKITPLDTARVFREFGRSQQEYHLVTVGGGAYFIRKDGSGSIDKAFSYDGGGAIFQDTVKEEVTFGGSIEAPGIPGGVFNELAGTISGRIVVVAHAEVAAISLTGLGKNPAGSDPAARVLIKLKVRSGKVITFST